MWKIRLVAFLVLLAGLGIGYFNFASEMQRDGVFSRFPFRLGLDLSGGTHLVYRADVSQVAQNEVGDAMEALRDVIERRVNLFGVAEPIVQVEKTLGIISASEENRLVVELPGVTDVDRAVQMIGQTPLLEFRLERPDDQEKEALQQAIQGVLEAQARGEEVGLASLSDIDRLYLPTELTGRFLEKAALDFDQITREPRVLLDFDDEGDELFAQITRDNLGKILAIYLDGAPISLPVIREEIRGGRAEITGQFTPQEAKILVGRLNSGALPVPIELLSSQTIGATLGNHWCNTRRRSSDARCQSRYLGASCRASFYAFLVSASRACRDPCFGNLCHSRTALLLIGYRVQN